MIDISNPLEWNLITRRVLASVGGNRIPAQTFTTEVTSIFVGISVPDEPTWYRGGYLIQYLPALPSSQANLFTALTQVGNYRLTCKNYQAIELAAAVPNTSVCTIILPPYFSNCTIEVFARNDI